MRVSVCVCVCICVSPCVSLCVCLYVGVCVGGVSVGIYVYVWRESERRKRSCSKKEWDKHRGNWRVIERGGNYVNLVLI